MKLTHYPDGIGDNVAEPLLFNPYQQEFQRARRQRYCLHCATVGEMSPNGYWDCPKCGFHHVNNLTAPRVYNRLGVLAGRQGGKTLIGAHAAREEMMVPRSKGWVMGPTYKILHDSTFPTLIKLIPKSWVKKWDTEHQELTLTNDSTVAFRSLEDPERARGPQGVNWGWFDEAAQSPGRAYDVFEPTLLAANGIIIATTTVLGFDWTWAKLEQEAIKGTPGYYYTRYWTEENPFFQANPVMMMEIAKAKLTKDPDFYAEEYKAERRNAKGLVYKYDLIEKQSLKTDDDVRKLIPEWPAVNPSRKAIIGLDSGADHPFGAVHVVVTERGLVVVGNYLKRMQAVSQQLMPIRMQFGVTPNDKLQWGGNKNEINLRLEFALLGVGVAPVENDQQLGIQRVASWLYSRQIFFAPGTELLQAQLKAYRYQENHLTDGQKTEKEKVFKLDDELCDALRYALLLHPELPKAELVAMTEAQQSRWDALSDNSKLDIERIREFNKKAMSNDDDTLKSTPGAFWGQSGMDHGGTNVYQP